MKNIVWLVPILAMVMFGCSARFGGVPIIDVQPSAGVANPTTDSSQSDDSSQPAVVQNEDPAPQYDNPQLGWYIQGYWSGGCLNCGLWVEPYWTTDVVVLHDHFDYYDGAHREYWENHRDRMHYGEGGFHDIRSAHDRAGKEPGGHESNVRTGKPERSIDRNHTGKPNTPTTTDHNYTGKPNTPTNKPTIVKPNTLTNKPDGSKTSKRNTPTSKPSKTQITKTTTPTNKPTGSQSSKPTVKPTKPSKTSAKKQVKN